MAQGGKFRDRVQIQREIDGGALDAYGNPSAPVWTGLGALWGDLREATGREVIASGRLEAPSMATLRFRNSALARSITAGDRIVARGATWSIMSAPIDPDGRGRLIEIRIERNVAVQ